MKASRFTQAQEAFILKQGAQDTSVAVIYRKAGISRVTCFNWTAGGKEKHPVDGFGENKYGGLMAERMRRLKAREEGNARRKKILADLTPDREMARLCPPLLRTTTGDGAIRFDISTCRESSRRTEALENGPGTIHSIAHQIVSG